MINERIIGQLIIQNCAYAMDGGSMYLIGIDNKGKEINILIPQHKIPMNFNSNLIPGRLHINGLPVEVRSPLENEIISKLIESKIECTSLNEPSSLSTNTIIFGNDIKEYLSAINKGENYAIAYMIKEIVDYLNSDEYIQISTSVAKDSKND